MQYLFDILLIAAFGLLVLRGYLRGFIRSILGFGRLILAFLITVLFGSAFSGWLDQTLINPPVYKFVNGKLVALADQANGSMENLLGSMPDSFASHLGDEVGGVTGNIDATVEQWSHTISNGISGAIAAVVGTILLFVLSFLALTLLMIVISKIVSKTPFAGPDKLLGMAVGAFNGVIAVILLSKVLAPFLIAIGQRELVDASLLLRFFS